MLALLGGHIEAVAVSLAEVTAPVHSFKHQDDGGWRKVCNPPAGPNQLAESVRGNGGSWLFPMPHGH